MLPARTLAALFAGLSLSACATDPPPGPAGLITPGKDKTAAAFQLDQTICQQHALAHTGYGGPSQLTPSAPAPTATAEPAPRPSAPTPASQVASAIGAAPAPAQPTDDVGFMQCMAARGDTVQAVAVGYRYPYPPYPYPYYPYSYGYPYGYPGSTFFFGGFGFHDRFFHRGFHGGRFHGGGFHGGRFHAGGHR